MLDLFLAFETFFFFSFDHSCLCFWLFWTEFTYFIDAKEKPIDRTNDQTLSAKPLHNETPNSSFIQILTPGTCKEQCQQLDSAVLCVVCVRAESLFIGVNKLRSNWKPMRESFFVLWKLQRTGQSNNKAQHLNYSSSFWDDICTAYDHLFKILMWILLLLQLNEMTDSGGECVTLAKEWNWIISLIFMRFSQAQAK